MIPIANRKSQIANPLGQAFYLGISWTWVIGMFLPVLLVRDYGVWAWVIFAIPNCLGAAAMGWVMRSREQSVAFTQNHAIACRIFSLVTIAFHVFFAVWIIPKLIGGVGWIVPAILIQSAFTPFLRNRGVTIISAIVWLISVGIAIAMGNAGLLHMPQLQPMNFGDTAGLGVVCLLGFIICPYFDLTFHRARQSTTDAGAKTAFGVGFCGVFASMIVFTLLYAATMLRLLGADTAQSLATWLITVHLSVQMFFTVNVHAAVLDEQAEARDDVGNFRSILSVVLAAGLICGLLGHFMITESLSYHGLSIGEIVYRSFLSFYGLICPAYALASITSNRPRWIFTGLAVVLAMPFYWLAFIERQMAWAAAGGAIAVVIGLIASATKSPAVASIPPQTQAPD